MLTETLSRVVHEIENLSDKEQNVFANLLSEELNWSKTFSESQSLLSLLADEALSEHSSGRTEKIECN